jgi:hypothetical protein
MTAPPSSLFIGCPEDCGHTAAEHFAFDEGLNAGEKGEGPLDCPADFYIHPELREAWLSGQSVGLLNREHAAAAS